MNLRKVAAKFENSVFDAYDDALPGWRQSKFKGKIVITDRFLSNFNRPTRRRLLGLSPKVSLPVSNTIRLRASGDVYITGSDRNDNRSGRTHDRLVVLHQCESMGVVTRKTVLGPANNPGHLSAVEVGSYFMDIELRTSSEQVETKFEYENNYFLVLPKNSDLIQWDTIRFESSDYLVNSVYIDSVFKFARVVERQDPRQDFVYHQAALPVYDFSTSEVTGGDEDYDVTGFSMMDMLQETDNSVLQGHDIAVFIRFSDIGVNPKTSDSLTFSSVKYHIKSVKKDYLGKQWKLFCTK